MSDVSRRSVFPPQAFSLILTVEALERKPFFMNSRWRTAEAQKVVMCRIIHLKRCLVGVCVPVSGVSTLRGPVDQFDLLQHAG